MPGAGKSTAAQALVAKGWSGVVMGDVIREETKRRGLVPDESNTGEVMRELRKKYGEAAVAELCMQTIEGSGMENVVVDGIRSMAEAETFQKAAEMLLITVHASRARRFALLRDRGRSDDPLTFETFLKRDQRELEVGIGSAIALADEVISNERSSPEALTRTVVELVQKWVSSLGT